MSGIYVGEEDTIELEDGTKVALLRDLSQGADDDLTAWDKTQGGDGTAVWTTKLLEVAITKIIPPDGAEYVPTYQQIRAMKGTITDRLRDEVMSRWYPLAWEAIKALIAESSGPQLIGDEDLAGAHQNGTSGPSS